MKGRIQGFSCRKKCLAEQQKRKHLKSERKLSAGRIKQSKSANTSSAWLEQQQHTAHLPGKQEKPDGLSWGPGHTNRLDSFSSTAGDLSWGKAGQVTSSPFVPQFPLPTCRNGYEDTRLICKVHKYHIEEKTSLLPSKLVTWEGILQ